DLPQVHQIQSGQVIVDLCSVVKELVENSLDAGATSIDVRFKNQGLDAVEVQDNGSGISQNNYETLALKHYTSKLATYSDLTSLETFGFRGEALSSLCALSNFTVTTCLATDVPKGTKLEYETSGKLRGTAVVAAQKGTTISVEQLFKNLPVRRRELERNIKREWNRVIGVLNQYACIQTGVKLSVSQQPTKGKRITLFSTKGNKTTRDNIVNVFGAKTLTIHVRGHVSRPAHGEGRQTPDRQMFFVNGRPCGLPQFAKVFNEVYKAYNASQSPFICADIQLDTHLYDVNVSPDKRTILLHDQPRMLDNLREALIQLFEAHDYAVPTSTLAISTQTPYKKPSASRENMISSFKRDQSQSIGDRTLEAESQSSPEYDGNEDEDTEDARPPPAPVSTAEIQSKGAGFLAQFSRGSVEHEEDIILDEPESPPDNLNPQTEERPTLTQPDDGAQDVVTDQDGKSTLGEPSMPTSQRGPDPPIPAIAAPTHAAGMSASQISVPSRSKRPAPELATITIEEVNKRTQSFMKGSIRKHTTHHLQQTLRIDEAHIQRVLDSLKPTSKPTTLGDGALPAADRLDADDAEAKLSLTISKADFLSMKIVGQFNLGFIIAVREGDDELFIIDQHATDEKYNFERLQASTVVQSQRLVQPKQLDLTALEEEVIKENIAALEANGFQVDIDESGFHPVGQRVRLLSLPLSRETTFDLADLEELVSLLTDHHEVVVPRPSKVRKMFAMRACRSSVMIGKSLTTKQMEKLVRHMGELDKPWNCPHGRPTMRHLCGLSGWDEMGWMEGSGGSADDGHGKGRAARTDWAAYLRG
ncbi:hypothetical protein Micbo1qcDRAFT_118782, partial [Microdochium bolleyi]